MKLKFILLLSTVLALSSLWSEAKAMEWVLVTDDGTKIPMTQVEYLMAADDRQSFAVVKTDNTLVEGVVKATFAQEPSSGITDAVANNEFAVLSVCVSNTLSIQCVDSGTVEIFDTTGALKISIYQRLRTIRKGTPDKPCFNDFTPA